VHQFNTQPRFDKPVLVYWLQALSAASYWSLVQYILLV
jgi:4-amino-4-deoxy-L-arabinose transferase-like glycosyltransferase